MRILPDKLWEVKMAERGGRGGKRWQAMGRIVVLGSHESGRGGSGGGLGGGRCVVFYGGEKLLEMVQGWQGVAGGEHRSWCTGLESSGWCYGF